MMKGFLRSLCGAFDILLAFIVVSLLLPTPAYAYVDPSVMTYTIQAIAGVAVALSAVLGVAFRRTRKAIFRIFNIDENAHKIKDPHVIQLTPPRDYATSEIIAAADEAAQRDKAILAKTPQAKSLSWPERFVRALITCGLPVFTLVIASTLQIVAGGAGSLNFTFFDVLPMIVGMGVICWLLVSGIVSALRGRVFDIVSTLMFAIGLCFYVQALFLNWPMTVADGSPLDLKSKKLIASMIGGGLVWIALIAGMLVFNAKKKSVCRTITIVLSCALIIVQGASLVDIGIKQYERIANSGPKRILSQNGLFEVSAQNNVVVFVLDTTDTNVVEAALEKDPSVFDEYTGFTYFRNSVAVMEPTRYAVPFLLSGVALEDGDTRASYMERRQSTDFIEEIGEQGYNIGIYTDSVSNTRIYDYMDNIVYLGNDDLDLDYMTLPGKLLKMSLYRDLLWALKPAFLFTTDEINRSSLREGLNAYVMDDLRYADSLRTEGLRIDDNEKDFRFIHLLGSHYPFVMDDQGHESTETTDMTTQTQGILRVVGDYLRQMKELGVYDQSTIIVTADHGLWSANTSLLSRAVSPLLMVKPAESAAEAAEPLKISDVPTGHLDYPATVIAAVGGDSSEYGKTVFEIDEGERERYFWRTLMDGGRTNADWDWVQYRVDGDALNFDDWELTGVTIPITPEDQRG